MSLHQVMQELGLIGLRIQRMPHTPGVEFGVPSHYPYMTVSLSPTLYETNFIFFLCFFHSFFNDRLTVLKTMILKLLQCLASQGEVNLKMLTPTKTNYDPP